MKNYSKQKILYGAGTHGEKAFDYFGSENVYAFVDIKKFGAEYLGKPVLHPSELTDLSEKFEIVICATGYDAVIEYLNNIGIRDFLIFHERIEEELEILRGQIGRYVYVIDKLDKLHEDVVEAAWNEDSERKKWVCTRPFTSVQIFQGGEVYTCCPDWLKQSASGFYSIGNIFTDSLEEIKNSEKAQKLRYSVSQGNFEYCTNRCPRIVNPSSYPDCMLPRDKSAYNYNSWQNCSLNYFPTEIDLCIDPICNLYCITCRNQMFMKADCEKIHSVLKNYIYPELKNCTRLLLDGCGEFLASKPYEQFLKMISKAEFPSLNLNFITNGQLFTPERWEKFSNLKGMKINISISIDAASKDVYEKIRRGGKWETLCENMEYISSLKTLGGINEIGINFVVQKENFHQLEDFVQLGKTWRADKVGFIRLMNNIGLSPAAFAEQDVFSQENPARDHVLREMAKLIKETTDIKVSGGACLG